MHLLAREEIGLRCLLRVAHAGPPDGEGAPVPLSRIAESETISGEYAGKLLRRLRLGGLVTSTRGASGGYRLARPAEEITVWDVLRVLDEDFLPTDSCACTSDETSHCERTTHCAVQSLWRELGAGIRETLEAVTVASLCQGQRPTDRDPRPRAQTKLPIVAPPHGDPRWRFSM